MSRKKRLGSEKSVRSTVISHMGGGKSYLHSLKTNLVNRRYGGDRAGGPLNGLLPWKQSRIKLLKRERGHGPS